MYIRKSNASSDKHINDINKNPMSVISLDLDIHSSNSDRLNEIISEMINKDSTNDNDSTDSNDSQSECNLFFENTIPKITMSNETAHFTTDGKDTFVVYLDNNNVELFKLLKDNNFNELNFKHKIYKINDKYLNIFISNILNTEGKYVYPLVFVNFVKSSVRLNKRITFDDFELLKLRIWANQLRLIHNIDISLEQPGKPKQQYQDLELYIGYRICCELLHYVDVHYNDVKVQKFQPLTQHSTQTMKFKTYHKH